ncbi:conserved membrane hypothetical protein [Sphingomonas sp. EC-HK361]|uniref:phosphatase PAP2 family protein n=1 Tax=Sphingomonas sp. EC-HK361 TaxID=2038397 RepID=UPI001252A01D|nr:phosphatase PAP2 family protein [Sphingomonas sp. EC-HK361]VVT19146.1 conserved membrane hypothetical protein [Sphingomonas sp. EC-HK361]
MVTATRGHLWGLVIGGSLLVAIGFRMTGLSVARSTGAPYLAMIGLIAGVAALRGRLTDARQLRLADLIELLGLFCWVSALGGLGSYAVAAASHGFHDAALANIDSAMGFDWLATYRFFAGHSWLTAVTAPAYRTIFATPLVVIAALTMTGRAERARTFVAVFGVALCVCLFSFYFLPARSALAYHVGMAPGYMPATGLDHVAIIEALRGGAVHVVDPARIVGLITFPSFHAVCAVLFTWSGWPVARLRMPLLLVNGMMLAATPVEGTHYLIDVIAGLALAAALIGVAHRRNLPASAAARHRDRTLSPA